MALTVLLLQLLSYACISGWKDAILWSRKGSDAYDWNEHYIFNAERACIGSIVLTIPLLKDFTFVDCSVIIGAFLLCFSFLHNGFYYWQRNKIDVNEYHWFSNSKTSTAWYNANSTLRTICFIIGVIAFVVYQTTR
jgi:hypothetical protein